MHPENIFLFKFTASASRFIKKNAYLHCFGFHNVNTISTQLIPTHRLRALFIENHSTKIIDFQNSL